MNTPESDFGRLADAIVATVAATADAVMGLCHRGLTATQAKAVVTAGIDQRLAALCEDRPDMAELFSEVSSQVRSQAEALVDYAMSQPRPESDGDPVPVT